MAEIMVLAIEILRAINVFFLTLHCIPVALYQYVGKTLSTNAP